MATQTITIVDQEQRADLRLTITPPDQTTTLTNTQQIFRFLDLPLELRLKIYNYLLPARTHTVVSHLPATPYFFNSSASLSSLTYPFGRNPPRSFTAGYKVLPPAQVSSHSPSSSIHTTLHPEILRVCKQLHFEAEPAFYGHRDAKWEFGIHVDTIEKFWRDRSALARRVARGLGLARELPNRDTAGGDIKACLDEKWLNVLAFITRSLPSLWSVDVTMWSSSGVLEGLLPTHQNDGNRPSDEILDRDRSAEERKIQVLKWRAVEGFNDLLSLNELKELRITHWEFQSAKEQGGYDSWLAGRMVADRHVRERKIKEGVVEEGVVVLRGLGV